MSVPFDGLRVSGLGTGAKLRVKQWEWLTGALEDDVFDTTEREIGDSATVGFQNGMDAAHGLCIEGDESNDMVCMNRNKRQLLKYLHGAVWASVPWVHANAVSSRAA